MDREHGVAFLIARIAGTKPSMHAARITIEFNSYAMLDVSDAWQLLAKGQRFPVAYMETSELLNRLQLNPDELAWHSFMGNTGPAQPQVADALAPYTAAPDGGGSKGGGFTTAIAEAKRKLAESLGIASEKIEITIRL